jgi:ATP dependent DNA ligase-like protein
MSLPKIPLMQADEVGQPFHRDGWIYEEKYDGWRMVAYKDGTSVRLVSRAGKDHSRRFAELAAAIRALPPATLILDGEVAIFDDKLISRFEWFRKRPPRGSRLTRHWVRRKIGRCAHLLIRSLVHMAMTHVAQLTQAHRSGAQGRALERHPLC